MSTPSTRQTTTGPFDAVHTMINNRPNVPNQLQGIVTWLVNIITAIIAMIEQIGRANDARITELEEVTDSHASTLDANTTARADAATSEVPATTMWQRSTTTSRRLPSRCNLCHARGHDSSECKTSNPAAMRKRVARNSRIAKEARASTATTRIPVPAPPPFYYQHYPPHVAPPPMNYAALAADATELRRRAAQSARDKRRKRTTTTS
jgi:hypothetical protein